jgi:predicted glycosyltransferase
LTVRLSILIYSQALSGVGHYVRSFEIARALGRYHDVQLVDGGRRVPRAADNEVRRLVLPRIVRAAAGIGPLESTASLAQILAERTARLRGCVAAMRPQVLVIEHFPFSKWDLEAEIVAVVEAARAARTQVLIVCSLRDIVRQTRFEQCVAGNYAAEVQRRLERDFDAIMVHGEERLTPLSASFPGAGALRTPLYYTGIVAEAPAPAVSSSTPYVLVSNGGGTDPLNLPAAVAAALATPRLRHLQLIACRGLAATPGAGPTPWLERPFGSDFIAWLAGATLSVSYAGYNTCANLLATRRRALLAVHPSMSDQPARGEIMTVLGAARVLPPADWAPQALANAISAALESPAPNAGVRLDGAERSAALIEELWLARAAPRAIGI